MVLLEGSIHKLKVDFNRKIQELKSRKKEIIDRVKKLNGRLKDINTDLNENIDLFEPSIDEVVEYPEKFFEVQDKDIDAFRKQKAENEKRAAASKKTNLMGSKKQ
jgi:cilia- and flagella-associated protein 44